MAEDEIKRIIPRENNTEQMVLGACIANGLPWWQHLSEVCGLSEATDLFYSSGHRTVANVLADIADDGALMNEGVVVDRLASLGLEKVGGSSPEDFVFDLVSSTGVSTIEAMETCASRLRDLHVQREMIRSLEDSLDSIFEQSTNMAELSGQLHDIADTALNAGSKDIPTFGSILDELMNEERSTWAVPTGFPTLDNALLGGWESGRTYVMAAGSGVGKTTTMFRFVRAAEYAGANTLTISLESSKSDVIGKFLSGHTGALFSEIRDSLNAQDWDFTPVDEAYRESVIEASAFFRTSEPKIIFGEHMLNGVDEIPMKIMRMREDQPDAPIIIFIDYAQLMVEDHNKQNEEITRITRRLHMIAQEMGVAMIMLSQFRKTGNGKGARPSVEDLFGASSIQNDADGILLMWRPALDPDYEGDLGPETMLLEVAKNRIGMPVEFRATTDLARCVIEEETEEVAELVRQVESGELSSESLSDDSKDESAASTRRSGSRSSRRESGGNRRSSRRGRRGDDALAGV